MQYRRISYQRLSEMVPMGKDGLHKAIKNKTLSVEMLLASRTAQDCLAELNIIYGQLFLLYREAWNYTSTVKYARMLEPVQRKLMHALRSLLLHLLPAPYTTAGIHAWRTKGVCRSCTGTYWGYKKAGNWSRLVSGCNPLAIGCGHAAHIWGKCIVLQMYINYLNCSTSARSFFPSCRRSSNPSAVGYAFFAFAASLSRTAVYWPLPLKLLSTVPSTVYGCTGVQSVKMYIPCSWFASAVLLPAVYATVKLARLKPAIIPTQINIRFILANIQNGCQIKSQHGAGFFPSMKTKHAEAGRTTLLRLVDLVAVWAFLPLAAALW